MKNYILSFLFLIILCSAVIFGGYVLRPKQNDVCISQIKTFKALESDSLDVIAYGSSHCWFGFDANTFSQKTGLNAYNFGCYYQSLNTTELFFDESLRTQNPEMILIETGRIADIVKNIKMDGQIYYTRKLSLTPKKIKYLYTVFGKDYAEYISYIFPIVAFHGNWENISEKCTDMENFAATKGQKNSERVFPVRSDLIGAEFGKNDDIDSEILSLNEYEGGEVGQLPIPEECIEIMDYISSECKTRNIRLIWYTVPYVGDYNYSNAMSEYAAATGSEYINCFEHLSEIGFDSNTDLLDGDHVNSNGAKKISEYLAEYAIK